MRRTNLRREQSEKKLVKIKKQENSRNHSHISTIEYIWPTSIPYSWERIMSKHNISKVKIKKSNRNTLGFLEETQKYINKICMPEVTEAESSSKPRKISPSLPLINKTVEPRLEGELNVKFETFRSKFLRNKRGLLSILKRQPIEADSLVHEQNYSCGSLYISHKKYS